MARINNFLRQNKWWILACSILLVLSLISLLALVVVLSENYSSSIETQVQLPSPLPTTISEKIDYPNSIPGDNSYSQAFNRKEDSRTSKQGAGLRSKGYRW